MLTDPALRAQVEALWDKLWTGGLSNPLDAIEQLSFLLFLKRLDEREQDNERAATRRKAKFEPVFPDPKLRWGYWTQLPAEQALADFAAKEGIPLEPATSSAEASATPAPVKSMGPTAEKQ